MDLDETAGIFDEDGGWIRALAIGEVLRIELVCDPHFQDQPVVVVAQNQG